MKKSKYSIIKLGSNYGSDTLHFPEYKDTQGTIHSAFDLNLLYDKSELDTNGKASMFIASKIDTVNGTAIVKG